MSSDIFYFVSFCSFSFSLPPSFPPAPFHFAPPSSSSFFPSSKVGFDPRDQFYDRSQHTTGKPLPGACASLSCSAERACSMPGSVLGTEEVVVNSARSPCPHRGSSLAGPRHWKRSAGNLWQGRLIWGWGGVVKGEGRDDHFAESCWAESRPSTCWRLEQEFQSKRTADAVPQARKCKSQWGTGTVTSFECQGGRQAGASRGPSWTLLETLHFILSATGRKT